MHHDKHLKQTSVGPTGQAKKHYVHPDVFEIGRTKDLAMSYFCGQMEDGYSRYYTPKY